MLHKEELKESSERGVINKDVKMKDFPFLKKSLKKGQVVYRFQGPNFGAITEGKAVTDEPGSTHFYEIPADVVDWDKDKEMALVHKKGCKDGLRIQTLLAERKVIFTAHHHEKTEVPTLHIRGEQSFEGEVAIMARFQ